MTDLEQEALNTCLELRDVLSDRMISRSDFLIVMSHLRDTIKHLLAKESGCATGTHFGRCTCKPAVKGESFDLRYRKPKVSQ